MLQETHATKISEKQWQKKWTGISFWNSRPIDQTAGIAIYFNEKFQGKIQNIKNDELARIFSITFTINEQNFQFINLYGSNKPYQRENLSKKFTYITNTQNTVTGVIYTWLAPLI